MSVNFPPSRQFFNDGDVDLAARETRTDVDEWDDCCATPESTGVCCAATFCPCCVYGAAMKMAREPKKRKNVDPMGGCGMDCCADFGARLGLACLGLHCLNFLFPYCTLGQRFRSGAESEGDHCCRWFWCQPCMLTHSYKKELNNRRSSVSGR